MNNLWRQTTLGDVYDVRDGTHDSPKYVENGYPLVTSKNLKNHQVDLSNVKYISEEDYLNINKRSAVDIGDVLFAMIGTIGNPIVIESKPNYAIKNVALFKVPESENSKFLKYYLETDYVKGKMAVEAKGTTQKFVGLGYLRNFPIVLPAPEEQKRIVAILDEAFAGIDIAIANTQKNLANARELFDSYLNQIFIGIAKTSESCELDKVSSKITKGSSPKWQGINYVDKPGVLFVTSENIDVNKMKYEKVKYVEEKFNEKDKKSILEIGDVLTNIVGASIGRTAVFDRDEVANINQAVCMIRCDKEKLINKYLAFLLNSPFFVQLLHDNEIDNARANLSLGFFRGLSIPLPAIERQLEFVSTIESIKTECDRLIKINQEKLVGLQELKQSLLQKAFSGELTANEFVSITSAAKPLTTDSPAFSAHVMAAVYHWHESQDRNKTFGRVKAQKTLHLVEALAGIDMGRKSIKDAAGPNDSQHMRAAEDWSKANAFFEFVQRANGHGYDFKKLSQYSNLIGNALEAIEPYKKALQKVVELLLPLNTEEAEILTTVYAAWNNLLLDGVEPTEEAIIYEARENWHPDKTRFAKSQFCEAIQTIRSNGIVPTGTGKRVVGQESMF